MCQYIIKEQHKHALDDDVIIAYADEHQNEIDTEEQLTQLFVDGEHIFSGLRAAQRGC